MQSEHYNTYGGYIYDPKATAPSGKKGAFVLNFNDLQARKSQLFNSS